MPPITSRGSLTVCGIVLVMLIAGCTSPAAKPSAPPGQDAPLDWVERALPNGDNHDHLDHTHHVGLSTPNFEILGWDPLLTDHMSAQAGGYECGDLATKDGRTLAVVHSFTSDVAFVLMDVTEPTKPEKIGELVMENTHVYDVVMTPDQKYVLLATSPLGQVDDGTLFRRPIETGYTARASFVDACTGTTRPVGGPAAALPYHSGVVLVDISDPGTPAITDFRPLPLLGGHSIVVRDLGGETIALVSVSSGDPVTNYYAFLGIQATALGDRLETYSIYETDPVVEPLDGIPYVTGRPYGHEGSLHVHPGTGGHIAYLADGTYGVTLLDITDPREPHAIGHWNDATEIANPDPSEHFAHTVLPIDTLWDGRHYSFVSEECTARPSETPSCLVYVLDTTDPAAPKLTGAWTLPTEVGGWTWPTFSPHYMAVIDRTLFVAHFHAGLWAFDVSSAEAIADLTPVGVFLPEHDTGYEPSGRLFEEVNQRPLVADVLPYGENLVTFDATSGVYVLRFDPTRPAPAPEPWPLRIPDART
ncbi:MAG: hypothetical protein KY455_01300 [Euryarchaeota archaeon]|nr:hypothetical protein [Euryarchaeota archaeon]